MDPWGWIDRTSYEFFGFVLVEYVVRGNRRPVTVLSYAVIKSTYGETRVLCLSLVPSKVIVFFTACLVSYEIYRLFSDVSILSRSTFSTFRTPLTHRRHIFRPINYKGMI